MRSHRTVHRRTETMSNFVKFTKLRTTTDCTFWAKFAELKIDKFKLDEKTVINLWGSYSLQSLNEDNTNPLVLDFTSFNEDSETLNNNSSVVCFGHMINTNTMEAFKQTNPDKFIERMGRNVLTEIQDGTILKSPWRLSLFIVLAYSDLKKYKFYYWVAHPTPFRLPEMYDQEPPRSIDEEFTEEHVEEFSKTFLQLHSKTKNYFTVLLSKDGKLSIVELAVGVEINSSEKRLEEYNEIYFAFYDPCTGSKPGWPLRNLLCLLCWHCPTYFFSRTIKLVAVRGNKAQRSLVFKLKTKEYGHGKDVRESLFCGPLVGWENNANDKLGPTIADLSDTMDPTKLSDRAINLNLKLMKWRLVPDLDLDKISNLRCLLLGAGTLGCSVARVLLGWGVNNVTFVDSANVSHSNTVRQSLYSHQDAVKHKHKAYAARDALINIRPSINAEGVVLHVPMPGHVVSESLMESTKQALEKLEELVEKSDVVFLLLDSREARWLPTVLCAAKNKIAINAALGFDSYTVQRHGTRDVTAAISPDLESRNPCGRDLGCYFCNDVTQPGNSQTDRTLDQQCTVSRPGLSQIAAGLAVELLIALLQHPKGVEAEAIVGNSRDNVGPNDTELVGLLGCVPHTIRGSLWNYDTQLTITHRFTSCTACSVAVISEYKSRGLDFVLDACNTPNYLEKLSGLEELLKRPDLDELCYALDGMSDDDEDDQENVIP